MTCAFVACHEAESCCLAGGCVIARFPRYVEGSDLKKGARATRDGVATKASRDPRLIRRKRKALR